MLILVWFGILIGNFKSKFELGRGKLVGFWVGNLSRPPESHNTFKKECSLYSNCQKRIGNVKRIYQKSN